MPDPVTEAESMRDRLRELAREGKIPRMGRRPLPPEKRRMEVCVWLSADAAKMIRARKLQKRVAAMVEEWVMMQPPDDAECANDARTQERRGNMHEVQERLRDSRASGD